MKKNNPSDGQLELDVFTQLIPIENVRTAKVDASNIVRKGNEFNDMPLNLSKLDSKFINSLISLVEPGDDQFKDYRIHIRDFINIANLDSDGKRHYNELPKIAEKLMQPRTFKDKDTGATVIISLLSRSTHLPGSGYIDVRLGPDLRSHLLNLKSSNSIEYQLGTLFQFNSKHSIRLYEKVIQWSNNFKLDSFSYEISYDDFRYQMGIEEHKYSRPALLMKNVIDVAIGEISSTTNLRISVEEIRPTRAVKGYIFHVTKLNFQFNTVAIRNSLKQSIRSLLNDEAFAKLCTMIYDLIKNDSRYYSSTLIESKVAELINQQEELILQLKESQPDSSGEILFSAIKITYLKS